MLLDVTPLSLGVRNSGRRLHKIIDLEHDDTCQAETDILDRDRLPTVVTGHVLQGGTGHARDNVSLGQFDFTGIPPAPRGIPQIEVTFDINADGVLNVNAKGWRLASKWD